MDTEQRLDRLERQVRRWRRLVMVMAVGIAALLVMGQTASFTVEEGFAAYQFQIRGPVPDTSLGLLGSTPDGSQVLRLGSSRITGNSIEMARQSDGSSYLVFTDDSGTERLELGLDPDGRPCLRFYDQDERCMGDLIQSQANDRFFNRLPTGLETNLTLGRLNRRLDALESQD
jgi:hypothetical protein